MSKGLLCSAMSGSPEKVSSHRLRKLPPSAYFRDGERIIDFVLAFEAQAGGT